jgi:hypothetical protein
MGKEDQPTQLKDKGLPLGYQKKTMSQPTNISKKELSIIEINGQSQNLTVLRGFPKLTLTQSLALQSNLNGLEALQRKHYETETILREKAQAVKKDDEGSDELSAQIQKDFVELFNTKYPFEFKTVPMSVFPEDIGTYEPKKLTLQNGAQVSVPYLDCLLESIGYSVIIVE